MLLYIYIHVCEEDSYKIKDLADDVLWVVSDSYLDAKKKDY